MKNKILLINACVRPQSRTTELSWHLLNRLDGEITEVNLYKEGLLPLCNKGIEKRALHDFSGEEFEYAKQFSTADIIVIAAPFWDLSFPSVLKIYLENITVSGITFEYSEEGRPVGKCKAKKLYYITTAGGYISHNNFGFDYVKALAQNFYGIDDVCFCAAEGLDIFGADVTSIMEEAKKRISNLS
ncbi:MAG: ACP phosphodiesterase [Ruminococcaceae bacterium]|nr:ACP phosphodiesterase [Oscillospiraceae bacterium]